MEHLLPREIATAIFLLLLGAARCHFVSAVTQPADRSSSAANWMRHVPAYIASGAWAIYVAWLVVAPTKFVAWERWIATQGFAELLGWIAIPFLAAGLWLFWYGHAMIGHNWSFRIRLRQAHQLVTGGPYRLVRHPLYTALFLGYLGTMLALQSWILTAWFPVFVVSYVLFAREEEDVLESAFGEAYRGYRRDTGMFIPRWVGIRAALADPAARLRARSLEVPADGSDD